jgi:hypothetical protein
MFNDVDIETAYKFCMSSLGDRGYCAKVVELLREVEVRRVFTWGNKPRFSLSLPPVEHAVAVAFDRDRNYIFIFLKRTHLRYMYVVALIYKRDGNDFVLSQTGVDNLEVRALLNGPLSIIYAP